MIAGINWISTAACRVLMAPFRSASPWAGLAAASMVAGLIAVLSFKYCSNQAVLRRRRDRALACLLELDLLKDDLLGVFGTLARIVGAVACYLLAMLRPMAVLIVPFGLLLVQLAGWFQYRPLRPGEPAVLCVRVNASTDLSGLSARSSQGVEIEAGPFVSWHGSEVLWRIRPRSELPDGWVDVSSDGVTCRKTVQASCSDMVAVSLQRTGGGVVSRLMHPLEPRLPADGPISRIVVEYPTRRLYVGAHRVSWVAVFLVLSLLSGAALKRPMRVDF